MNQPIQVLLGDHQCFIKMIRYGITSNVKLKVLAATVPILPPWFSVQLPAPMNDMIEVRICADESTDNEDTPVELVEIYLQ